MVAAVGAGDDSGWRRVRQLGALVAAGAGRLRQLGLGDGLKAWAAQVRQQAAGRHASRQARRPSRAVCGRGRLGLVAWCG